MPVACRVFSNECGFVFAVGWGFDLEHQQLNKQAHSNDLIHRVTTSKTILIPSPTGSTPIPPHCE